jgi:hypothetical protein
MRKIIAAILFIVCVSFLILRAQVTTNATFNPLSNFIATFGFAPVASTNGIEIGCTSSNSVFTGVFTNSCALNETTNELVTGKFVLLPNSRSTVTVTVSATTSSNSGLTYSNSVTGQIRNYTVGPTAGTNTITIVCNPNSLVAVTNATVVQNTSEIQF